MKKIIFLMMTAICTATTTFAQAPQEGEQRQQITPDERAKRNTDRLNDEVKLTPEQYTKVLALNKDMAAQREALGHGQLTDEQKTQMRDMRKQMDDKLKAILTPEQWEKHNQARQPGNRMSPAK